MLDLKSIGAACILSTSALLGCTHTAHPTHTSQTTSAANVAGVTLQSHHWTLQQASTSQGSGDTQWLVTTANGKLQHIGLRFHSDQTFNVDRLCNAIQGQYQAEAQSIHIRRVVSTMMACPDDGLMRLEQMVGQQLTDVRHWQITGSPNKPILQLKFANGSTWQLAGKPTYETLYGKSEQIFLEVAPQKVACTPPHGASQCLQVREVQYNAQGIKTSTGNWAAFYSDIEGYAHQSGVRNVLRLKRYLNPHPPADRSKYIYVLDLTVESEIQR